MIDVGVPTSKFGWFDELLQMDLFGFFVYSGQMLTQTYQLNGQLKRRTNINR